MFKPGDRIVRISEPKNTPLDYGPKLGKVYIFKKYTSENKESLFLENMSDYFDSSRFALEEVYNSPLYQVLKEE